MLLSQEQLKNLNKDALIIIASSLQDQLNAVHPQLDNANAQLAEKNRQMARLIEHIRIMNQRQHGQSSELNLLDGQLTLFDTSNEVEASAVQNAHEPEITEVIIPSYARRKSKGTHDEDLEGLPTRIIDHRFDYTGTL